jgi:serine/threonine-protein kinase HipA
MCDASAIALIECGVPQRVVGEFDLVPARGDSEVAPCLLAATDGHAKNLSIHLLPQGHYRLTPLYDVLSAWPVVGAKHNQIHPQKLRLAMALRGRHAHYHLEEIDRRLFNHVAHRCGYGLDMEDLIESVIAQTPKVIDQVGASLPNGFPEGLFAAVTKGLLAAQRRLAAMPAR